MSWYADVEDKFKKAAVQINKYPPHSLGWYLGIEAWNAAVSEVYSAEGSMSEVEVNKPIFLEEDAEWDEDLIWGKGTYNYNKDLR